MNAWGESLIAAEVEALGVNKALKQSKRAGIGVPCTLTPGVLCRIYFLRFIECSLYVQHGVRYLGRLKKGQYYFT